MATIHPYLTFGGNCSEAMNFYQGCLGGRLTMQTVADSPMSDEWAEDMQGNVLHAMLVNDNLVLLASDMTTVPLTHGNTVSLSLTCSSEHEINKYFSNLSKDGMVTHPLHDFFAGRLGALTDKFGISWLLFMEKHNQ